MKLSRAEFRAMNNPIRQALQRWYEFPIFRSLGLADQPGNVLEIGCGSGYGAVLLASLHPRSYVGVDLMPEQIALAQKRGLDGAQFIVSDATNLSQIPSESKDTVVIFGVLHHIPPWRSVIGECARVLRPGGRIFLEEPDNRLIDHQEKVFHWGHPDAHLSLPALEACLVENGFKITGRKQAFFFGHYSAQRRDRAQDYRRSATNDEPGLLSGMQQGIVTLIGLTVIHRNRWFANIGSPQIGGENQSTFTGS